MLKKLQAMRNNYLYDQKMYWALTIAIDHEIGLPEKYIQEDMERLRKYVEEK